MPLHVSSTMCSSSGGQNCVIQPLISSHSSWAFSTENPEWMHTPSVWYFIIHECILHHTDGVCIHSGFSMAKAEPECDDTRCCIIQFWPPDDEHIVLETLLKTILLL